MTEKKRKLEMQLECKKKHVFPNQSYVSCTLCCPKGTTLAHGLSHVTLFEVNVNGDLPREYSGGLHFYEDLAARDEALDMDPAQVKSIYVKADYNPEDRVHHSFCFNPDTDTRKISNIAVNYLASMINEGCLNNAKERGCTLYFSLDTDPVFMQRGIPIDANALKEEVSFLEALVDTLSFNFRNYVV